MDAGKCKKEIPDRMSMYKNPWPWRAVVLLLYSFHCIACSPPPPTLQQCPVYSIAHGGKCDQKYVKTSRADEGKIKKNMQWCPPIFLNHLFTKGS